MSNPTLSGSSAGSALLAGMCSVIWGGSLPTTAGVCASLAAKYATSPGEIVAGAWLDAGQHLADAIEQSKKR